MTNNTQHAITEKTYRLVLATNSGTFYFSPEQIVRMESCSSYTNIFFTDRKPILASKVLKDFEEVLEPFGFLRTHRSHLVNRKYITRIANDGDIVMEDLSRAELSRRKKAEILKLLRNAFLNQAN